MKGSQRERAAFAKAAEGDISYRTQEFCLRTQGMECNCLRCAHDTTMVYGQPTQPGAGPLGRNTPRPAPLQDEVKAETRKANNSAACYENRIIMNSTRF